MRKYVIAILLLFAATSHVAAQRRVVQHKPYIDLRTLHFGILFVVGIAIGMITPPVAINLFVASGITRLPIEKISRSVVPYLIGLIVVFLAIVFVPLVIPGLM